MMIQFSLDNHWITLGVNSPLTMCLYSIMPPFTFICKDVLKCLLLPNNDFSVFLCHPLTPAQTSKTHTSILLK